ncbi:MAG: GGDEF domain-containing protein [Campylobacterota bacterium]
MNSKQKVILSLTLILLVYFIAMGISTVKNFRDYGLDTAEKKAKLTAEVVKSGLTAHMINGIMSEREYFLREIEQVENINQLWLSRSPSVIKQYGEGFNNEIPRDDIDKEVLKTGKKVSKVTETASRSLLRVTIPYEASSYGNPNCMSCHNAKEGEVLGSITMVMDITDIRSGSLKTLGYNIGFTLVLIILIFLLISRFIKPYVSIFYSIQDVMKAAYRGDYSQRVESFSNTESKSVAKLLNTLLEKLQYTLEELDRKVYVFIKNKNYVKETDPLKNVNSTIDRLSDIYKFKQTIENDKELQDIYNRLAYVLEKRFELDDFTLVEIDNGTGDKKIVYTMQGCHCDILNDECRANRISASVDSSVFSKSCSLYHDKKNEEYICTPYVISTELTLILTIVTKTKEETTRVRGIMSDIEDYVTTARPAIVSKKLMQMLNLMARVDQLTGMYNRKFLDEFVDVSVPQAKRAKTSYALLMIDIDYFKMINDTYGHDIGDDAIRVVSRVIKDSIRKADIAIRYGGEEFLVLLYNCDEENILKIANNIRRNFAKEVISADNESFSKTLSVGCSVFPTDSDSIWKCIKFADMSLYEAKQTGRNKVVKFSKELLEKDGIGESF